MFQPQTFQTGDIASVAALVLLEGLLSADNALVLAIMVRHLPKKLQQRALLYGLGGAFAFRLIAILLAGMVLQLWWLQALGAVYLLFLPIKHFTQHAQNKTVKPVGAGFWPTVIAVEVTDIAFAIDSVLAGVAFINNNQSKIWVVYLGAVIGIILLRFAAAVFIRLLEKYPVLDHVAYLLVGWVGVKLAFLSAHSYERSHPGTSALPAMPSWLFWTGLLGIAIVGTLVALKNPNLEPSDLSDEADVAEDAADLQIDQKAE
jgi:YkoY family integral membrane protein